MSLVWIKTLCPQHIHTQLLKMVFYSIQGMFFWDYGNAFLLESRRAGADISPKDTIASEEERSDIIWFWTEKIKLKLYIDSALSLSEACLYECRKAIEWDDLQVIGVKSEEFCIWTLVVGFTPKNDCFLYSWLTLCVVFKARLLLRTKELIHRSSNINLSPFLLVSLLLRQSAFLFLHMLQMSCYL